MDFVISEPCEEPWEDMELRPGGRFCERCQHTVVDLTGMTERQARSWVGRMRGEKLCVQLLTDGAGDAFFRPPPSRAPHWAGGLVLVTALGAGGCASAAEARDSEVAEIGAVADPEPSCETSAAPMMPVPVGAVPAPPLVTGPVPSGELTPGADGAEPTPEQLALTARKARPQANPWPARYQPRRGGLHLRPVPALTDSL